MISFAHMYTNNGSRAGGEDCISQFKYPLIFFLLPLSISFIILCGLTLGMGWGCYFQVFFFKLLCGNIIFAKFYFWRHADINYPYHMDL